MSASIQGKTLPEEILGEIALKTEGVPLFVEELTKTIIESDLLVEQADRYQVVKPVSSMSIPATLQDSLLARLDRLDEVKEIVQVGSVIGREFSLEILNEVMPEKVAALEPSIQKLMEVDILRHQMEEDQSVYQFKHALIQDTAYESLLRSDRKRIHRNVAMTLENKFFPFRRPTTGSTGTPLHRSRGTGQSSSIMASGGTKSQ